MSLRDVVAPDLAAATKADDPYAWAPALRERRRQMGAPSITGIVHTLNEERNLPDALRSLGWVDEVLVIDMHSDDGTQAIAERSGAQVLLHERVGYVEPARNFGIDSAEGDWTLILDADERIVEGLAEQLTMLSMEPGVEAVQIPWANFLCGARIRATGWGDENHCRFFRRGMVRWPTLIHGGPSGGLELPAGTVLLPRQENNQVEHHNYRDLTHFAEKTNRYTSKEPESLRAGGTEPSWELAAAAARHEIDWRWSPQVDGTRSVALTMSMVFYRLLAHAKLWEEAGGPDIAPPADGRAALRAIASDADARRRAAVELLESGDVGSAFAQMATAIRRQLDPELLNDLAVALHAAGRGDDARSVLEAALAFDPDNMGVRDNLVALGRSPAAQAAPPAAAQPDADVDATAEWLDFDRRPKPDPNFLITPVED